MHLVNRLTQHNVRVFKHRERRKTHRLKAVVNDETYALHTNSPVKTECPKKVSYTSFRTKASCLTFWVISLGRTHKWKENICLTPKAKAPPLFPALRPASARSTRTGWHGAVTTSSSLHAIRTN